MTLLLLVILVLVLMGGIPAYTYSSGTPLNSIVGVVLAIVLIMLLFGLLAPYVPYHRMW